jgi:hypothetical protein
VGSGLEESWSLWSAWFLECGLGVSSQRRMTVGIRCEGERGVGGGLCGVCGGSGAQRVGCEGVLLCCSGGDVRLEGQPVVGVGGGYGSEEGGE